MTKVLYFDDYTTYNFKGPCKLNTRGMKNWRFSTNILVYLEMVQDMAIVTMEDH